MRDTEMLRADHPRTPGPRLRPQAPHVSSRDSRATFPQHLVPATIAGRRGGVCTWASSLETWPASGGGLLLGMVVRSLAGDMGCRAAIKTAFLRVDTGGRVTVIIPYVRLEAETAQCASAVVAAELGVDPDRVAVDQDVIERSGLPARRSPLVDLHPEIERSLGLLAAAASALLISAAAENWCVAPAGCRIADGAILDSTAGRSITFAQIMQDAVLQDLPAAVRLRSGTEVPLC